MMKNGLRGSSFNYDKFDYDQIFPLGENVFGRFY